MSDKLLVIVLIVGGILIAALGGSAYVLKQKLDTAIAEKDKLSADLALKQRELVETQGDLTVSAANAARNLADKDDLIKALLAQQSDDQETDRQYARIHQDISDAKTDPQTDNQCVRSAPVHAALVGLGQLHQPAAAASGDQPSDGGLPDIGVARKGVRLPKPAGQAQP